MNSFGSKCLNYDEKYESFEKAFSFLEGSDGLVDFDLVVLDPLWRLGVWLDRLEDSSLNHSLEVTLLIVVP